MAGHQRGKACWPPPAAPLNSFCMEGALLATASPSSRRYDHPVHAWSFRRPHWISDSEHPLGGALLLPWPQSRGRFPRRRRRRTARAAGTPGRHDPRGLRPARFRRPQSPGIRLTPRRPGPLREQGEPPGRAAYDHDPSSRGAARRQIRRTEVVGARVSSELFRNGLLATGLALVAVLVYIWFRFEWQFGVGVVATLILDITKTVGFFAVTQIQFDLNSVAALLTLIGYSVTDKVVVYDRIRENLGKYRTMQLRQLIDLSINQT